MCKDEFLKKINELKYEAIYPSNDNYKYSSGFNECREKISKMALELDINGLNPQVFKNFQNSFDEIAFLQAENLRMQKELFEARREIIELKEIIELESTKNKNFRQGDYNYAENK